MKKIDFSFVDSRWKPLEKIKFVQFGYFSLKIKFFDYIIFTYFIQLNKRLNLKSNHSKKQRF